MAGYHITPAHRLPSYLKQPLQPSPCFSSCHLHSLTNAAVRLVFLKYKSNPVILVLKTRQWLPLLLRVKIQSLHLALPICQPHSHRTQPAQTYILLFLQQSVLQSSLLGKYRSWLNCEVQKSHHTQPYLKYQFRLPPALAPACPTQTQAYFLPAQRILTLCSRENRVIVILGDTGSSHPQGMTHGRSIAGMVICSLQG